MSDENKLAKIPNSYDKEVMYKQWKAGTTLKDLAEKWNVHYRTMRKYKELGKWEERKIKDLTALQEQQLKGKSVAQSVGEDTYTKMLRVLHFLADNLENQIIYGVNDENGVTIPIKTLTECIDKLLRLHKFVEHDGVERKHVVNEKIDWDKLIKAGLEARKNNSNFDEDKFAKTVIDAAFTDVKKE